MRRGSEAGRSGEREAGRSGGGVGMGLTLIHPVTDAGQDPGDVARGGRGSRGALLTRETRRAADAVLGGGAGRDHGTGQRSDAYELDEVAAACRTAADITL